jgi:hypothetical protein
VPSVGSSEKIAQKVTRSLDRTLVVLLRGAHVSLARLFLLGNSARDTR